MQSNIQLERLKTAANTPEALKNILSNFTWKRSQNGYRAKQHGSYSIYCKSGQWLFTTHNGDYKGGNVLAVAAEVHNLDLKTKDGLFEAVKVVCEAANLRLSDYCSDAPIDYTPTERKSQPIETKAFLPNAAQPISKNFTFEIATPDSYTHKAGAKYYDRKTGAKRCFSSIYDTHRDRQKNDIQP